MLQREPLTSHPKTYCQCDVRCWGVLTGVAVGPWHAHPLLFRGTAACEAGAGRHHAAMVSAWDHHSTMAHKAALLPPQMDWTTRTNNRRSHTHTRHGTAGSLYSATTNQPSMEHPHPLQKKGFVTIWQRKTCTRRSMNVNGSLPKSQSEEH